MMPRSPLSVRAVRLAARLAVRVAVLLGLAAATPTAEAQTRPAACADRETVVQRLAERYGETLQSLGLHQDNSVLEVYASDDTGTWTILLTRTDGMACLVAAGQMWEGHASPLDAPGKDA
jgi:hypothetical protein